MPAVATKTSTFPATSSASSKIDPANGSADSNDRRTAAPDSACAWAADLAREAQLAPCTTIGLVSGNRFANNRRTIDSYVKLVVEQLQKVRFDRSVLVVRLEQGAPGVRRREARAKPLSTPTRSPLGAWSDVHVDVSNDQRPQANLLELVERLPVWKNDFGFLLLDLGPISEVSSRVVGRLCDGCYIMLGAESCGSYEWLMRQIAWHARSGSTICGTLLTTQAA
jgi:hypothetical protein